MERQCDVDGCTNPSARRGLCWGHLKRIARGQTVNVLLFERSDTPWERLMEAVFALCDLKTTDSEGWFKARDRLRKTVMRYAASEKKPNQHTRAKRRPS
jgi:hypothetical protein